VSKRRVKGGGSKITLRQGTKTKSRRHQWGVLTRKKRPVTDKEGKKQIKSKKKKEGNALKENGTFFSFVALLTRNTAKGTKLEKGPSISLGKKTSRGA